MEIGLFFYIMKVERLSGVRLLQAVPQTEQKGKGTGIGYAGEYERSSIG